MAQPHRGAAGYLAQIIAVWGYELSEIEQSVISADDDDDDPNDDIGP